MMNNSVLDPMIDDSCQWFKREWKFVSLMEVLRLYAEQYCHLASHAQLVSILAEKMEESIKAKVGAEIEAERLFPVVREMQQESERIGLTATRDACTRILQRWEVFQSYKMVGELCRELLRILDSEFKSKICFVLPPTSQTLYDEPFKGWEEILAVFPDARDDVEQMRRCEAFGCHSAAVFHALLVVEFGLIALGGIVGVKDLKPGWDSTCNAVEKILQNGRKSVSADIAKHFGFLELVNKDMQSMKMAWRNKVSHAANNLRLMTSDFKPEVANKIITAAHGFMLLLATEGPLNERKDIH
jgi:hypothetical protein